MDDDLNRSLGRIEGRLRALDTIDHRLECIETRLTTIEQRGAVNGAYAGTLMGAATSLVVAMISARIG